jgi:NAD(P)H-hydrate epimerase
MNPADLPKIVTAAQMRAIDERAIQGMGIPSLTLMENAGRGVASVIRDKTLEGNIQGRRVAVVCGRGNNGGDGFVVGRFLAEWGARVTFYLIGARSTIKGDAKINCDRVQKLHLPVVEIGEGGARPAFDEFDLLLDGIFGTGFHGPATGVAAAVVDAMNQSGTRIVAIDSPSGLNADTGECLGSVISAFQTVTLACSKKGQWLWPGRSKVGLLGIVDIGIPKEAVRAENVNLALITEDFVRLSLPARPPDGHKGTFGKALIIGGSVGMSGAVALAANACMRCGVGLTYAGCPESLADLVDMKATEPVILPLPEVRPRRVLARRGLGEIVKHIEAVDALAIGPGLSTHHETQELVRRLVARRTKPTVLDADGLNAFAKSPEVLGPAGEIPLIITPHVGEMARLLGSSAESVASDREGAAHRAAAQFGCIVVMKGAPTLVAEPGGQIYLNPVGNSGMASGGVGDVLTGILVSFLAQGCEPLTAALMGVYIHGLAGDFAATEIGERSLVASDLVDALPEMLQFIELCGRG